MIDWFLQLQGMLKKEASLVIVCVASVKGSTPREPGARMLVTANRVCNTIGGGHLEYKAIEIARNMLSNNAPNTIKNFTLGAGLGQCCGGVVNLFFEVVNKQSSWLDQIDQILSEVDKFVQVIPLVCDQDSPRLLVSEHGVEPLNSPDDALVSIARTMLDKSESTSIKRVAGLDYVFDPVIKLNFKVYLFGAGHVGEALIMQLAEQPCEVVWVDTRDNQLPEETPDNVVAVNTDMPEVIIEQAPAGSYFLVMTHDHSLDLNLSKQILIKDDYQYFGLIGSITKRKKFEHRLLDRGINNRQLSKMICPIGIDGIQSKRPAAIALAVTVELVQRYEQYMNNKQQNIDQPEYKESLKL